MSEPFLGMPRPELVEDGRTKVGNATRGGLVGARGEALRCHQH